MAKKSSVPSIALIKRAFDEVAGKKAKSYDTYLNMMGLGSEKYMQRETNVKSPSVKKDRFYMAKIPSGSNPVFVVMANIENTTNVLLEEMTHLRINQEATDKVMRPLMQVRPKENIL